MKKRIRKSVLIPLILLLTNVVLWTCTPYNSVFAHTVTWRKEVKVKIFIVDGANETGKLTADYIGKLIKDANKIMDDGVTAAGIPGGSHIKLVWKPDPAQFKKIDDPWPPPPPGTPRDSKYGPGQKGDICEDPVTRTDPNTGKKIVNTNDGKYDEDEDLLRKVRDPNVNPNCTHGLSIVFVRDFVNATGHSTGTNGLTPTPECNPQGITKLKQCVGAETLAHELMHAMGGIRHGQSKQATEDLNGDGKVDKKDMGWDANGDGKITKEDKEYLLWGRQRGTTITDCGRLGRKITQAQLDKLVKGADKIPCTQNITDPPPTPTPCWTKKYPSYGVVAMDIVNDTFDSSTGFNVMGFDYIDILTSEAKIYFDPQYDRLSLYTTVLDTIPLNETLRYGFMLNSDNNNDTGCPDGYYRGSDLAAIVNINATGVTAALYKYVAGDWEEVAALDWLITDMYEEIEVAIGVEDWPKFLCCLVRIDVPLHLLNLTYHGIMPIGTFAEDVDTSVVDTTTLALVPLEIVFPPVVCLGQRQVTPCTRVPGYGCKFTPRTTVRITFEDIEIATAYTDDQGYFATDIKIPGDLPPGDYFVYTTDAYGKSDITTVTVVPMVGGIVVPVDKFGLLAPYIGLASTILVATVATAVYVKRVKRRKEKQ